MVLFFANNSGHIIVLNTNEKLTKDEIQKLEWLFNGAEFMDVDSLKGFYVGPRRELITPWSTNAVEIIKNIGIKKIMRVEEFFKVENSTSDFDPMLQMIYNKIDHTIFDNNKKADDIIYISDIDAYNAQEGLALSDDEISHLKELSSRLKRKLTDSEVFGFSQVNSEHCRHKIFNGTFIIDGEEKQSSLFDLIKKTSKINPHFLVSAYKDNVAFIQGPDAIQFSPESSDKADFFNEKKIETVLSLKAETHNFPTTVEPFNGAATGTGGEIRDRMAGGRGSLPLAGTAVYMTSYPRSNGGRDWEKNIPERPWLYQSPEQILMKASNGASDYGNKIGQPLISGSLVCFEHYENYKMFAFDKVIMLAGGIGFAKKSNSIKDLPSKGDQVIVLGGDNYRIGMGGGAGSSVATGEYDDDMELNAVQRSNPAMQAKVLNVIKALTELEENPIISIHDHGAGGHLNCLSELIETIGGEIYLDKLPIGDPSLSAREIVGNESQERMGLLIKEKDIEKLKNIAEREQAPWYVVGEATGDMYLKFKDDKGRAPIDMTINDMFGNLPKTIIEDQTLVETFSSAEYSLDKLKEYLTHVLQLEAVACKDWLINKVDRSVSGKVAKQQTAGEIQLPLNNAGVMAIDYQGKEGLATAIGHAPVAALIDPKAGSILAVAEALTNIVWAPSTHGLKGVSLSANWMWPGKNKGEDARLYEAVEALSDFAIALGINVPTGKDSLSMTQKYKNGDLVFSPGTVIVSAVTQVSDVKKVVEPVLKKDINTTLVYVDLSKDTFKLGGSSFLQILNKVGNESPIVCESDYFKNGFAAIQELINKDLILAGHDISAGGMITTLLEMCFANTAYGIQIDINNFEEEDIVKILFSENPGVVIQLSKIEAAIEILEKYKIKYFKLGTPVENRSLIIKGKGENITLDVDEMRDIWYKSSFLLDSKQSGKIKAQERYDNYKNQALNFNFPNNFKGTISSYGLNNFESSGLRGAKAAIVRGQGVNGDREMAYALYLAGFDVKDVHMTDLISGTEDLKNIDFLVFPGGYSNAGVFGPAKGWAASFLYNEKAANSLNNFFQREDTLSFGVGNGCQLMVELNLIYPSHDKKPRMLINDSNKFESGFSGINICENNSVMLKSLAGSRLGAWFSHKEGKFSLPLEEKQYHIPAVYTYENYPANPNGSDYNVAAICSMDGRHLAMMPHPERSVFPWQWAYYSNDRKLSDEVTPWIEAFVNARKWIDNKKTNKK